MVVVLPAPFGPEVAHDLALGDLEVELVRGIDVAVSLGQPLGADCRRAHGPSLLLVAFRNY